MPWIAEICLCPRTLNSVVKQLSKVLDRRPRKREPSRELIFRHRIDPPVTELPLAVSDIDKLFSEWIYVQKEPKMITAASNLERPAVPTDIPAPPSSQLLVPSHRETHLVPATMLPG
ncbi:hypothetical protein KIN20_016566 [Parelaphostrongylus tenuis]|uniref:Uncharacterized protein n=1 Tax=Parelaphostrongylus tenuis TaxID=148309 RepID=A0AAD5QT99_PARTN|nr:hypothetical protein KIN20_016566 [Parelaphostrongylus tenuis]